MNLRDICGGWKNEVHHSTEESACPEGKKVVVEAAQETKSKAQIWVDIHPISSGHLSYGSCGILQSCSFGKVTSQWPFIEPYWVRILLSAAARLPKALDDNRRAGTDLKLLGRLAPPSPALDFRNHSLPQR
jgi:hypothetical protein